MRVGSFLFGASALALAVVSGCGESGKPGGERGASGSASGGTLAGAGASSGGSATGGASAGTSGSGGSAAGQPLTGNQKMPATSHVDYFKPP